MICLWTMTRFLLGCDGGGTKTVAELAILHDDGEIETRGEGVAGPGNVLGESSDTALRNLNDAIDIAFQTAGLKDRAVDAMVLSLAGAGRESERAVVRKWIEDHQLAQRLEIVPDCRAVFEAGLPDGIGVVLVAGTGSIAMGRSPDGNLVRSGGWGPLLGDEGGSVLDWNQRSPCGHAPVGRTGVIIHLLSSEYCTDSIRQRPNS